jgi:hypothetical protein
MSYLVLGLALLVSVLLLARWATAVDPRSLARLVRVLGGAAALAVLGFVVLSGRVQWLLYALPFALPVFFHWRSNQIRRRNAQGPKPGQRSQVDTAWIHMELDHDTGAMQGTVRMGRFAGRELASMEPGELLELLDECGADPDSVGVLEAYLDRVHGPAWRGEEASRGGAGRRAGQDQGGRRGGVTGMSPQEAYEILGLAPGAGADEIKDAHRRLMAKLHPDRGGSNYLAAKLNAAKDLLLKRG